jgi:hypothetical protein
MKRTPLSRRPSQRKQAFDAEYAALLPCVLANGCQFAAYAIRGTLITNQTPKGPFPPCSGRLVGHHAKGRKAVDANDHLICLCSEHHTFVHANPRWAREVSLMLSRTS